MRSNGPSELLDLERGLPTTQRDVEVLRSLRRTKMTDAEYVSFLASFGEPDHEALAAEPGPRGEPFSLA